MIRIDEINGNRAENLEMIKSNNNDFIAKLESITEKPSDHEVDMLMKELARLCSYTNAGAYGSFSDQYEAENDRIANVWIPFCDRVGIE
jgi:hypothetical protein